MNIKKFIIYDATKAFARHIRLNFENYQFEVYHKHQQLFLNEEIKHYDIGFVYVNSNDDLFALLWMIGKVNTIIAGYSTPFFEFMVYRIDGIERINLSQTKRIVLGDIKQVIDNSNIFYSV